MVSFMKAELLPQEYWDGKAAVIAPFESKGLHRQEISPYKKWQHPPWTDLDLIADLYNGALCKVLRRSCNEQDVSSFHWERLWEELLSHICDGRWVYRDGLGRST